MNQLGFVSDLFAPEAISARQSVNLLLLRALASFFDEHKEVVDILKRGKQNAGTPFFFNLSENILADCIRGQVSLTNSLICSIQDSFLEYETISTDFFSNGRDITLFPRIYADLQLAGRACLLRKGGQFSIGLEHPNCYVLAHTNYYGKASPIYHRINGGYSLVLFSKQVEKALDVLRNTHKAMYERICAACTFFTPIEYFPDRHYSFTADEFPRLIYLSPAEDALLLSRAIAHEFGHYELNCLNRYEPLVSLQFATERCYSPWREDPRPPIGLLHALYVFCEVAGLLVHQIDYSQRCYDDGERILLLERQLSSIRAKLLLGPR